MNGLAASRPPATTSSVGGLARAHQVPGRLSTGLTIMMATSPSASTRPATTIEKVAPAPARRSGNRPTARRHRRARHRSAVERKAGDLGGHGCGIDRHHVVLDLRVECQHGHHDLDLVVQTWTKAGRSGRSIRRQARSRSRDGPRGGRTNRGCVLRRTSSSTSTVSGKKSMDRAEISAQRWPTAASCRHPGRPRQRHRPAEPAHRPRNARHACRTSRCR